jgi:starch phosphorylase
LGAELSIITDLSLEFLMGRALDNAMLNTGMKDIASGECSQW